MALERLYAESSDIFLDEACTWLGVQHDITITPSTDSTLRRNLLEDPGLARKILWKLTAERHEAQREEFKLMLRTRSTGDGFSG